MVEIIRFRVCWWAPTAVSFVFYFSQGFEKIKRSMLAVSAVPVPYPKPAQILSDIVTMLQVNIQFSLCTKRFM